MSNLANYQYPPPKHWQDFESLCHDLWKEIWKDPNAQKNGRSGQEQHGVDVFGCPNQGSEWVGVQCKGKDGNLGKFVSEKELTEEAEKAKNFDPTVSSWILATTAPRDAKIQETARKLSKNKQKGIAFTVFVWSWDEIIDELVKHPSLVKKHLPQVNNLDQITTQKIDNIDVTTQQINSSLNEQMAALQALTASFDKMQQGFAGVQNIRAEEVLTDEYNAEIDDIKKLMEEHQYSDAVKGYERLKNRIWSKADDKVKFRILTNLGSAYYSWGKLNEAGPLFIEAYQYNPDEEISLTNLSIAYSFQSDFENTEKYARQILEKNPNNLNGYSILLQIPPYKDSFDKAFSLIPERFREEPLIAFCLGLAAQDEKKFDISLHWLEIALKNDKENSPDFKSSVAVALIQNLWSVKSTILYGQISQEDKNILNRVISLLTQSWEQIKDTDLKVVHPVWILNRGIAHKLLGNLDNALEDIKTAYNINSSDIEFIKHLALIHIRREELPQAIALLETIKSERKLPEISLILADIYNSTDNLEKAVSVTSDFLVWAEDKQLRFVSYRILVDVYLKLNDIGNAELYADKLLEEFSDEVSSYTAASRVARRKNDEAKAVNLLIKAKSLISEATYITDLVELADDLFNIRKFKEALECYELFTDIEQDTRFTLTLLFSYYNAGILSKALNLCSTIRHKHGILFKYTELEIAILEEINDLAESKKLAIEYLRIFPENLSIKLRLARLNYLTGSLAEVDSFLDEPVNLLDISLENGLTISSLLAQRGRIRESFDLMYELRRKHYDKAEAHSFYIANFFLNDKKAEEWLNSDVVDNGFAVRLERIGGNREWYLIDDRLDADLQKREFKLSHPLIQGLIKKKLGNTVQIKKSAVNEEFATIVEIKNKYIYALHETCEIYETMFPDRNDFWSMNIRNAATDEDKGELNTEKIREILSARSKLVNEVMELYYNSGFTVGLVAELLHSTALESWEGLLINHQKSTYCCVGDPLLLNHTINMLSKTPAPRLAADITSIHIARLLKVEDKIVNHFGKFLVAPTTLFSLYIKLEELKKNRGSSLLSLSEKDGTLYRNEISSNEVEQTILYLEELVDWIKSNCEISPHRIGYDIERNYKAELKETILPEFLDTFLIAENEHYLLFTEDERLSQIAILEVGAKRAWMQPVLITLKNKGVITDKEYDEAILTLTFTNLTHIHFNEKTLLKAAEKSDWQPVAYYLNAVRRLRGGNAEVNSATDVALNFLIVLNNSSVTPERRKKLIFSLLGNLVYLRNRDDTLRMLIFKILLRLNPNPYLRNAILTDIAFWKNYQFVLK